MTVTFQLFNVGASAAVDVELNENGFKVREEGSRSCSLTILGQPELFTPHVGSFKATWKSIPAGTNVTHTFVVKPKRATEKAEPFYGYPAVATYASTTEGPRFSAYSNDVGAFHIYQRGELAKRVKSSLKSWIVVFASVLLSTGAPLLVWRRWQSSFPNGLPRK